MGLLEDVAKKNIATGLIVGLGAYFILPRLLPGLSETAKPIVKGVMKSGILCFEKSKEIFEEIRENTEDLWAEVKAEMEEKHSANLEKGADLEETEQ